MSLVTQTYPPPTEGVSQQPDDRRRNNQVEDLINGVCDPIRGLQKRPPTVFLGSWVDGISINTMGSFENAHVINRSDDEQYIVTFHNSTEAPIRVFDFEGNEYTVNYGEELRTAAVKYFLEGRTDTRHPNKYLKAVTIADYTIICNPNVVTKMTDDYSPKLVPQALTFTTGSMLSPCYYGIQAKNGTAGTTQRLAYFGVVYVGWWTTVQSLAALYYGATAGKAGVTTHLGATRPGNYYVMPDYAQGMAVINRSSADEVITTLCNNGGSSFKAINNEVSSIDDLPNLAPDGYKVRIRSYDGGELADYWLEWRDSKSNWIETIAPEMQYKIDAQTMPWGLIRQADGTFLITTINWDDRKTGDDDSNPIPSFIDDTISNIFFYRNRLGFISGENVILSEASEFFNFWYDSAVDVLATDPIDEAVPSTSVMRLRHAIPMETDIVLFANDAEYLMRAEGVLSPTNIAVDFLSSYAYDVNVTPINIGNDVYFVNRGGSYSSLYRYTTLTDSYYQKYGDDVSQHVPYYIPNNVRQMIGNTGENFVALLTDDEDELNSIYIYKYIVGEDRQFRQQAWSKWKFKDYYKINFITYINNYLYIQFELEPNENGAIFYEWHRLEFGGNALDLDIEKEMGYHRVYSDRKVVFTVNEYNSIYDEDTDTTTIDLWKVYPNEVDGEYWIVASAIEEDIKDVPIESLKISPQRYYMTEGDMQILTAILTPDNTTQTDITWTVSDESMATIVSNGLNAFLTAHKAGEIEVKCTSTYGLYGIQDTIIIEIDEAIIDLVDIKIDILKDTYNFGLRDYLIGLGYTNDKISTTPFNITINIPNSIFIGSVDTGMPSLTATNLHQSSVVTINNDGYIIGKGGNGGNSVESEQWLSATGSRNGDNGGDAIRLIGNFRVDINNSIFGLIKGGGGGGGSISYRGSEDDGEYDWQASGGGGGGNGAAGTQTQDAALVPNSGIWTPARDGAKRIGGNGGSILMGSPGWVAGDLTMYGGRGGDAGENGYVPTSDSIRVSAAIFTTGGNAGNSIVAQSSIKLNINNSEDSNIGTIVRN